MGHPSGADLIVAVPRTPVDSSMTIDRLVRGGSFDSIKLNWPTLQFNFDIEA